MNFKLTLAENLPPQTPSALWVVYTFTQEPYKRIWVVTAVTADTDACVLTVNSGPIDLINQYFVETRVLKAHYPVSPYTLNLVISSVQLP